MLLVTLLYLEGHWWSTQACWWVVCGQWMVYIEQPVGVLLCEQVDMY